jgi:hypothetical protein
MKKTCRLLSSILPALGVLASAGLLSVHADGLRWNADALKIGLHEVNRLPPPPEGVEELAFGDFFKRPVGRDGLEYTDKIRALEGKRVRILGFMVRQGMPMPGVMLLAPFAFVTHEAEYGLSEDLPVTTLFVKVEDYSDIAVPFTPGPLLLTGVLELGRHEESDGRVSYVRLRLDPPAEATP